MRVKSPMLLIIGFLLSRSTARTAPLASPSPIMIRFGKSGQKARIEAMDLKLVREEAIEGTTRFFWDNRGFVPNEDSEEWEAEYRRQFELAKARHADGDVNRPQHPSRPRRRAAAGTDALGGTDRRADADPLGGIAANRKNKRNPRSRRSRMARHHLDPGEKLDRHPGIADPGVFAADRAALSGIPQKGRRGGARSGAAAPARRKRRPTRSAGRSKTPASPSRG